MATQTELLNLDGVAQRVEGVRFELRSAGGAAIGSVTPNLTVAIENRADQSIKRSISNFVLAPSVVADVNTLTDQVAPYWVIGSTQYPLGVFLFAAASSVRLSYGLSMSGRLLDKGTILAQPITQSLGFSPGTLIRDALATTFLLGGINSYDIAPASTATIDQPLGWAVGSNTTYAQIATQLCTLAGLADWFFDNTGNLRVVERPNPAITQASLVYATGAAGRVIAGSAVEQNNLLDAPNRFIAVDTAARDGAVSGTYDLPGSAPHSFENRKRRVTAIVPAPGVGSAAAAEQFARTYAESTPQAYETVTFSGPPDPRHDTHDIVSYLGQSYREQGWKLTCSAGGPHEHSLTRVYA